MIERVAVVGGGTMGVGIAYRFAVAGFEVDLVDTDDDMAAKAVARVVAALDGAVSRDKLSAEAAEKAASRLWPHGAIVDLEGGLGLVIEAVPEEMALKRRILEAAELLSPGVLATNTSSLSIDGLATSLARRDRFAGMHFFNPVWVMDLVEVIRGTATSDETITAVKAVVRRLGMQAAVVNDRPGFASTRLGILLGLEAMRMVEEGVAEPEDIDRAMELGYRHAMGPLKTGDLVGLDVRLAIAENLASVYGERFEPPDILRRMVAEGLLGKKTGRGFYTW